MVPFKFLSPTNSNFRLIVDDAKLLLNEYLINPISENANVCMVHGRYLIKSYIRNGESTNVSGDIIYYPYDRYERIHLDINTETENFVVRIEEITSIIPL